MKKSITNWRMLGAGSHLAKLPGGEFHFDIEREDLPFPLLCDVAVRNNQKRRFLFVSKMLGRHIATLPSEIQAVSARLAGKLRASLKPGPVVFIGMAETATTLGQSVFREFLRQGGYGFYIESTRRSTGGKQAFSFSECHSHATAHVIHLPSIEEDPNALFVCAPQVVVVDDEATTARTAAGLVHAMKEWRGKEGIPFEPWLAVILKWNQVDGADEAFAGIVSVMEGKFSFKDVDGLREIPVVTEQIDSKILAPKGIRHGGVRPQELPERWKPEAKQGEKILVIGNGEYGFQPLLLAEALEKCGAKTRVMATTRSPILPGGAINHRRSFPALSGEGYTEFLYNVPAAHGYDRVILCMEDAAPAPSHPVFKIPNLEVVA